jgi:putative transposase
MVAEGLPVQTSCRVLGISVSGFFQRRNRPPSARTVRHAWLTDAIRQVHVDSRGTYGARRVHAELTLGHGIAVGHSAVELLMRRAGLQGLTGRPRFRRVPNVATSSDLVTRDFGRSRANELWVTDITEHPTREGKVYCCVVLDAWSRRVVGWSIDSSPNAALVTNALGMAIDGRQPAAGTTVIHSDQGT